mgnify:FL=1
MKIKNHLKRAQEIRNDELRMEYLRITMTIAKAEKYFDAFKKDCEEWLDNIYKDGVKTHE